GGGGGASAPRRGDPGRAAGGPRGDRRGAAGHRGPAGDRGQARLRAGVLNVDKPAGTTSFAVVRRLRELTRARRVGHAGTLDPLATGVLPILFESATRLSDFAHGLEKTYEAEVHLGFSTPTDDAETDPEPVASTAGLTSELVAAALQTFAGRVRLAPPALCAVHGG